MRAQVVCTLLCIAIAALLPADLRAFTESNAPTQKSTARAIDSLSDHSALTPSAYRIDFGVTADDFGTVPDCASSVTIDSQFVWTQSVVFGTAVDFPGGPTPAVVTVADGACDPWCRTAGDPPFLSDWWCQFREGTSAGVPGQPLGVNQFSAELCFIDDLENGAILVVGYDAAGNVVDGESEDPSGGGVQVLTVEDPLSANRIVFAQIVSSADLVGLTVDYVDYDDPGPPSGVAATTVNGYYLENGFPNPCNPTVTIRYGVPEPTYVNLTIYDASGHVVRTLVDEFQTNCALGCSVVWDGLNDSGQAVSSGLYFYRLKTVEFSQTKKLVLLK